MELSEEITNALTTLDIDSAIKEKKETELKEFLKQFSKEEIENYQNQIFNYNTHDTLDQINVKLEFVKTVEQRRQYDYYRYTISSVPQPKLFPGKILQILVRDEKTQKVLGLIQLSQDSLTNQQKYDYLEGKYKELNVGKFNKQHKRYFRDAGVNISACVPVQPFGYNYCGGKLLAKIAFSREVFDYYYKEFNLKIKYVITTSINGKSVQYNDLKELKYIGLTDGYSTFHISPELLEKMKQYLKIKESKRKINRDSNQTVCNRVIYHLKLDPSVLCHNHKRGIYIGTLTPDSLKWLYRDDVKWNPELKGVDELCKEWKMKYASKRFSSLNRRGIIR